MRFTELSKPELSKLIEELKERYKEFKNRGLKLDMSRGKPAPDQLDMADGLLDVLQTAGYKSPGGVDCRNYGLPDGLPEAKSLFAEFFGISEKNIIVGGNSSLNLMFDCISQGYTHGFGSGPWSAQGKIKFLCPAPGYDRHFAVTEYFGFELIPVKMLPTGPDMDEVKRMAESDPLIKGVWCVPKYSNPTGITYSEDTVRRFAALSPAAGDFRIFWDNSYFVHDINGSGDVLYNIFDACKEYGSEDMVLAFTSTSKISYPGAGVACLAASEKNIGLIKKRIFFQTIGPDKINQLRHLYYFKDTGGILSFMKLHAEKIQPKFKTVLSHLENQLKDKGIARWTSPNGGYFISLDVLKGCAKRVVTLCGDGGVVLTPAGATFPYGIDPDDSNIRIAPTFPPIEELDTAMELLCIAVQLAAAEKLLNN